MFIEHPIHTFYERIPSKFHFFLCLQTYQHIKHLHPHPLHFPSQRPILHPSRLAHRRITQLSLVPSPRQSVLVAMALCSYAQSTFVDGRVFEPNFGNSSFSPAFPLQKRAFLAGIYALVASFFDWVQAFLRLSTAFTSVSALQLQVWLVLDHFILPLECQIPVRRVLFQLNVVLLGVDHRFLPLFSNKIAYHQLFNGRLID